ncbi:MAG: calcium-binding protein [Gallionella sp.]|nr:calcium-binding protein [Gallionella sp.]
MNNSQPSYEFLGGNDALDGESVDIYLFNLGIGQDIIDDTADIDILRIGTGILPTDITLVRSGMDVVLGINGTDDRLIFRSWRSNRIERIEFSDGTVWHAAYLQLQISADVTGITSTGSGQASGDDSQTV